jgi:hypothetical protein
MILPPLVFPEAAIISLSLSLSLSLFLSLSPSIFLSFSLSLSLSLEGQEIDGSLSLPLSLLHFSLFLLTAAEFYDGG